MTLAAAERKIAALKSAQNPEGEENEGGENTEQPETDYTVAVIIVTAVLIVIGGGAVVARYFLDKKKEGSGETPAAADKNSDKEGN